MLRKHRFFIAGMALTMVIVLLCMILPGQLLKLQSRRHVGEIIRARGLQVGQAQERGRLDLAGLRQEGLIVQLATGAARIGAGQKL